MFSCFTPRPPQGGARPKAASKHEAAGAYKEEEPLQQSNPTFAPAKPEPEAPLQPQQNGHGPYEKPKSGSQQAVAPAQQPKPAPQPVSKASSRKDRDLTGKLKGSLEQRSALAQILKEHCLVESGEEHVTAWMREEGYAGHVGNLTTAVEEAASGDPFFWATRYHLFVSWSPDRSHPWDALPAAGQYATLEMGLKRGSTNQVVILLEGRQIERYTFKDSILKTTEPVEWETPSGAVAQVNFELQFSAFFGYGQPEAEGAYLGLQCHGVLWPVAGSEQPHYWPISPPRVSGKVNIAGRDAATSPGSSDSLAAFAGTYATHVLPTSDSEQGTAGAEVAVKVNAQGQPEVAVAGRDLAYWTFDASNVLAWEDEAGFSAWLQFVVLPGGPVFMGHLRPSAEGGHPHEGGRFTVFGELVSQPSRLAPDAAMDATVGALEADGLATAATILCGRLLRTALRCWSLLKTGMGPEDVLSQEEDMLVGMRRDFEALERVQAAAGAATAVFPAPQGLKALDPSVTKDAVQAEQDAAEQAQAARISADAVATAVALTNDCIKDGNAVEATSKAAASAWRASQAAAAAAQAEESALAAARHSSTARTSAAFAAAVSAAQSFNLAKDSALAAARAEAAAASNALKTVETGINFYAMRKEYLKLKDIAEASDVAGKALAFAKEAVEGWEAGTVASRGQAQEAAKQAAEYSQLAHKLMRVVYRNK